MVVVHHAAMIAITSREKFYEKRSALPPCSTCRSAVEARPPGSGPSWHCGRPGPVQTPDLHLMSTPRHPESAAARAPVGPTARQIQN
eukprot:361612-Chlamydomonas_euryale.AAC.20